MFGKSMIKVSLIVIHYPCLMLCFCCHCIQCIENGWYSCKFHYV